MLFNCFSSLRVLGVFISYFIRFRVMRGIYVIFLIGLGFVAINICL
jgi:hypothetical protein